MPNRIMPYVVLKGIREGNKFFTSFNGDDPTRLATGEVAYEVLGYANTVEEAQKILHPTKLDRDLAIAEHLKKTFDHMASKGQPISAKGKRLCLDILLHGDD